MTGRHRRRRLSAPRVAIGIGATIVFGLLASIPLIPAASGVPEPAGRYPVMNELPDRASGAYLAVDGPESGYLKLFPWSTPPDAVPAETPAVTAEAIRSIVIVQKALDDVDRYVLFRVGEGEPIPVGGATADGRRLDLVPDAVLRSGEYLLDVPTGGMFAGREYYFFTITER